MGRVLSFVGPRRVEVVDEDLPDPGPGEVRVRTWFSGVSAGTELTAYAGTNPRLVRRWDPDTALFHDVHDAQPGYPLVGWGYSEVGAVVEVGPGVTACGEGDLVWGIWGHRTEAIVPEVAVRGHLVPGDRDPRAATFVRVATVALNAVLNTQLGIGSVVAVVGLGVIGLLATRFAVQSGATVVAVDPDPGRRALALGWGARSAHEPGPDLALQLRMRTQGRGADVALEMSGSPVALHDAVRLVGPEGIVVASGFYQGEGIGLRLGEEFHHNRVRLQSSQVGGVPPQLAARWTRERLVSVAAERLLAGDPDAVRLITHTLPLDRAVEAYHLLESRAPGTLQVLFDLRED